jgi:hypothetical protein
MDLVKKLDAGPRLKNPSLLTVFRLYCVNNKSSREIALHCRWFARVAVDGQFRSAWIRFLYD